MKLSQYYIKRWKGIYPMFYLAFGVYWLRNVLHYKSFTYDGHPLRYIYTLLGIDGYITGRVDTYYILGEWFLGAIIILYALFPLLRWAFNKSKLITFAAVTCLYLVFLDKLITSDVGIRTVSSCLFSFVCGMVLISNWKYVITPIGIGASLVMSLVLYFVKLPIPYNISVHLLAISMYVVLSALGEWLAKNKYVYWCISRLGKLSYPIFLIHHRMILDVLVRWHPSSLFRIAVLFLLTFGLILVGAELLTLATDLLTKRVPMWLRQRKAQTRQTAE